MNDNENWYDLGRKEVLDNIVNIMFEGGDSPTEVAEFIYGYLSEIGLIDYDVEKDVFYEWYAGDAE